MDQSNPKTTRFDASRGIAKSRHCTAGLNAPVAQIQHKSRMENRKYHAKCLDLEISSPAGVTNGLEI